MADTLNVVCPHCDTVNRVEAQRIGEHPQCGRCRQALFTGVPVALNAANFDRNVERGDLPIVVDFWAPWCQPCQMMAPAFERAAAQLEPQVRLAKLNTDQEPALASRFGIRGIPTLVIYHRGTEVARQSGAPDYHSLVRWIRAHA